MTKYCVEKNGIFYTLQWFKKFNFPSEHRFKITVISDITSLIFPLKILNISSLQSVCLHPSVIKNCLFLILFFESQLFLSKTFLLQSSCHFEYKINEIQCLLIKCIEYIIFQSSLLYFHLNSLQRRKH